MATIVSISEAKKRRGEFADRAIRGEQSVIVRKSKSLALQQLELPDPPLGPSTKH